MEDKQIIIHGVDVSRCMFFNEEYEEDDIQIKNFCEWQFVPCQEFDCAKCYFKNWKRKEQECEELKNFHINLVGVKECEIKELLKLKQTLTEIKKIAEVDCSCGHNQMCICNVCDKFDEILQKISEVEDVANN